MIIYNEKKSTFIDQIKESQIEYILKKNINEKINRSVSVSEVRSWRNSLSHGMATLLDNFYKGCYKAYGAQNQLDMEPLCA